MKNINFEISEFVDNSNNNITMSSVAIVDLINMLRDDDDGELHHRKFMGKVPQVIGEHYAAQFCAPQKYGNNNTRDIYNLPKREACLMLMSYSYDIQAAVYDKLIEYENKLKNKNSISSISKIELAQLVIESEQARIKAEDERDNAIRTKAHISDKKTATALANSGVKTKIINKLNRRVDELEETVDELIDNLNKKLEFYSIKAVAIKTKTKTSDYSWQLLTAKSKSIGRTMPKTNDDNYGEVKTYHVDVWLAVYSIKL